VNIIFSGPVTFIVIAFTSVSSSILVIVANIWRYHIYSSCSTTTTITVCNSGILSFWFTLRDRFVLLILTVFCPNISIISCRNHLILRHQVEQKRLVNLEHNSWSSKWSSLVSIFGFVFTCSWINVESVTSII
jgi:hypothetical protein